MGTDKQRLSKFNSKNYFDIQRNVDGFCYERRPTSVPVKLGTYDLDECYVSDIVSNYFIARTNSAGKVRMDPHFAERAHREWFLDGIGGLRIAKCTVAPILHDSGRGCKGRSSD